MKQSLCISPIQSVTLVVFSVVLLFATPSYSVDLELAWLPNGEADLEGYGIYFRKGSTTSTYDLYGYIKVSELSDSTAPSIFISDLNANERYYFAVTAYDTEGWESPFSSSICVYVDQILSDCSYNSDQSIKVQEAAGGGSGGGGGCFIRSFFY